MFGNSLESQIIVERSRRLLIMLRNDSPSTNNKYCFFCILINVLYIILLYLLHRRKLVWFYMNEGGYDVYIIHVIEKKNVLKF